MITRLALLLSVLSMTACSLPQARQISAVCPPPQARPLPPQELMQEPRSSDLLESYEAVKKNAND